MRNLTETDPSVKGDLVPDDQPAWPPSEPTFLAVCDAVFGDSIAIWIDEPTGQAERSLTAAREALRRAHLARAGALTDWKAEAARELNAAVVALDTIPPGGRVLRAVVDGLRHDIGELRAVLAGER